MRKQVWTSSCLFKQQASSRSLAGRTECYELPRKKSPRLRMAASSWPRGNQRRLAGLHTNAVSISGTVRSRNGEQLFAILTEGSGARLLQMQTISPPLRVNNWVPFNGSPDHAWEYLKQRASSFQITRQSFFVWLQSHLPRLAARVLSLPPVRPFYRQSDGLQYSLTCSGQ